MSFTITIIITIITITITIITIIFTINIKIFIINNNISCQEMVPGVVNALGRQGENMDKHSIASGDDDDDDVSVCQLSILKYCIKKKIVLVFLFFEVRIR